MFSRILEKLTINDNALPFELTIQSGVTIRTVGQRGLDALLETLNKFGLSGGQQHPTPAILAVVGATPVQASVCTPPLCSQPAATQLLLPSPVVVPLPDKHLGLVESIKEALKSGLAQNQVHIDTKIAELLAKQDDCPIFSEARTQFMDCKDERTHHSSVGVYHFFFSSFEDFIGDKKINDIKSKDINRYLGALACMPPNTTKNPLYKGKTFSEIIEFARSIKAKAIARSTQKKCVNYLRAFFNWCYDQLDLKRNPCSGIRIGRYKRKKEQARKPFDAEDLKKIFDRMLMSSYIKPHKYWVPIIALYSGMRVNEVTQLFVSDVMEVEAALDADGNPIKVLCFSISAEDGKSVKTEHSERYVPVHSKLLELGLMEYIEDVRSRGLKYLFPDVKRALNGPGAVVSAWFNNSLLRTKCDIEDRTKSFHGFRNTFWTYGDRSKVLETAMIDLVGYGPGENIQRIHYIKKADVAECKKALESIQYPNLDLYPYKAGHFKDFLDGAKAKASAKELMVSATKKPTGRPKGSKNAPKVDLQA